MDEEMKVSEQPAGPDDVHYYSTELRTGLTNCGVDVYQEDDVLTTSESGKATCSGCLVAAGEDPPGARDPEPEPLNITGLIRDSREIMALLGVTEAADVHAELTRRLAALVPQQLVQARDFDGYPWLMHGCGFISAESGATGAHDMSCTTGPWRPLLVGGDPAPSSAIESVYCEGCGVDNCEQHIAPKLQPDSLASINTLTIQRDDARAEVERIREQWRNDAEIGDEYAAWADQLARAALKHTDVHETEEASGSEELWGLALDALTGKVRPDGRIVLRLPEFPPGTVALIGVSSGATYPKVGAAWGFSQSETGVIPLGELLDHEGEAIVELAPEPEPQQPRTAAEVWASLTADERDGVANGIDAVPELTDALNREAGL